MPDKKLTDNEIIKALECCRCDDEDMSDCENCPLTCCDVFKCHTKLATEARYLINDQAARIEMLHGLVELATRKIVSAKAEAIKEFAERLKRKEYSHPNTIGWIKVSEIDNLVKEMVGE